MISARLFVVRSIRTPLADSFFGDEFFVLCGVFECVCVCVGCEICSRFIGGGHAAIVPFVVPQFRPVFVCMSIFEQKNKQNKKKQFQDRFGRAFHLDNRFFISIGLGGAILRRLTAAIAFISFWLYLVFFGIQG